MKKLLLMLLAVMFCTSALCTVDVIANNNTSDKVTNSETTTNQNSVQEEKPLVTNIKKGTYSEEEVYLTAQLVYHEAHNQDYNGKVAIAEVVLNRVNSGLFPDTIEEVLFQKGQFAGRNGLKKCNPTIEEIRLTSEVLNGSLRIFNDSSVMYFRNPKITSGISAKTAKNWGKLKYFTYIGEHAFYSQTINAEGGITGIPSEALKAMAKANKKNRKNNSALQNEDVYYDEETLIALDNESDILVDGETLIAAENVDGLNEEELTDEQIKLINEQALAEAEALRQAEIEMHEVARQAKEAEMEANTKLAMEMQAAAQAAAQADMEAKTLQALQMNNDISNADTDA